MTTTHETTGGALPRPWATLILLGLAISGILLVGGCDEEDNNWKSAALGENPDLALAMSTDLGGDTVHVGRSFVYTLTAQNLGGAEATAVVVADTLPASLTLQTVVASQGTFDPATGYWALGDLAPAAQETLTLTARVALGTRGQTITNVARVIASEPEDIRSANNRATVSLTAVNAPPIAMPDSYVMVEGETLHIPAPGLLSNDSDTDGESISLNIGPLTAPLHGNLTLINDGSFIYIHSGSDAPEDSFRYIIVDASAEPDTGLVTITITPYNDPPLLQAIFPQTIGEGMTFPTLRLDEYVADPDDPDSSLTWVATGGSDLVATISSARRATVAQPNPDWFGQEIINYQVSDPAGRSAQFAVTYTVLPVNDPPIVRNIPDQTTTQGGAFLPIPLDDQVDDVDNADATIQWSFRDSGDLLVTIGPDRVVTVAPPSPTWVGRVTITFVATDLGGLSDSDLVQFIVEAAK